MKEDLLFCRVCGYEYEDETKPWYDDEYPSYEICLCCGVHFGISDTDLTQIREYRENWIKAGAVFFQRNSKPHNWNLNKQLELIPDIFR
ncbi:MAG: hypothetical protein K9H64_21715 [Bacteroidales bacterium]|nr:hypothetical protein [Bacteroidales bacterium]MCF8458641.1 hypothetical protein [Bacteroidales bacterium]